MNEPDSHETEDGLRAALAYEAGRANRLERELRELREKVDSFCEVVECAQKYATTPKTGMRVPFHGDFAFANPSTLSRLGWWARHFKDSNV